MAKPRDDRQRDLLRPSVEEIIDPGHSLVRLARTIDWPLLDDRLSRVGTAGAGRPAALLPAVAGHALAVALHALSLSVC